MSIWALLRNNKYAGLEVPTVVDYQKYHLLQWLCVKFIDVSEEHKAEASSPQEAGRATVPDHTVLPQGRYNSYNVMWMVTVYNIQKIHNEACWSNKTRYFGARYILHRIYISTDTHFWDSTHHSLIGHYGSLMKLGSFTFRAEWAGYENMAWM